VDRRGRRQTPGLGWRRMARRLRFSGTERELGKALLGRRRDGTPRRDRRLVLPFFAGEACFVDFVDFVGQGLSLLDRRAHVGSVGQRFRWIGRRGRRGREPFLAQRGLARRRRRFLLHGRRRRRDGRHVDIDREVVVRHGRRRQRG